MRGLILALLQIFEIILFARAVLSWFPIRPDSPLVPVQRALFTVTEPVLAPVRRIVPRTGMFDLSFMVVFFGVIILQQVVASS